MSDRVARIARILRGSQAGACAINELRGHQSGRVNAKTRQTHKGKSSSQWITVKIRSGRARAPRGQRDRAAAWAAGRG
jgi:hypothetical protein